ncbi:MAG: bifunctional lysine ketoglutarate reductase /saccharopine dehydrogenase family protein [Bacteroidales bacterium]|jgi:saccharopine dehydrogenase (NAD+, L-lysine-forming)|nr:bifunctional lysine ketoglutarate reductase /saccharopine dehydrogenase family protein [Bacteroidales bacterium]MDG1902631.1 bifunctional lysine ketoglutarate reductase /saccharopine dehydrogenase family protein [Bacteroidales bacterium]MDG2081715.1 bifunctional lysine ketoglutarate reductase /saccharopine dehydrogenase family protein [Bacteroidales bacterium]|tara:strand:- start:1265 stop:2563 length:1299 start_codon:yes stop_codon:yes gene_type:complete
MHKIGIRHEDKYVMERRVSLVPEHVKQLISKGLEIEVVNSSKRVYDDSEFEAAGATLVDEVTDSTVILGVKEMPMDFFREELTYIFFSHIIKGQPYNMPLLKQMMRKKINLIEYEKIVNDKNQRLIFFGRYAGLAGMINSLWSAGQRWNELGIITPFLSLKQTHRYNSLEEAKEAIALVGEELNKNGLPSHISPIVTGFTGYGNVSKGAQEIYDLLSPVEISPDELTDNDYHTKTDALFYKVIFKEKDISDHIKGSSNFDLQEYYNHPELFKSKFEQYIPHLTILMNCMYWDDRYPAIVTKDYLEKLYAKDNPKLLVIGDVTCDPDGSIECTHKGTEIEDPVFVYNPITRKPTMGFKGKGILVMAVDILPSELPRESSQTFSDALVGFMLEIAETDFDVPFEELRLPKPIKKALILHKGKLTPDYEYLKQYL